MSLYRYIQFCNEGVNVERIYCVPEGDEDEVIRDYLRNGLRYFSAEPLSPNFTGYKVLAILVSPLHDKDEVGKDPYEMGYP